MVWPFSLVLALPYLQIVALQKGLKDSLTRLQQLHLLLYYL